MDWTPASIRDAREARGWTQQNLADQLDASLRAVLAWEKGESAPSRRFARALDRVFAPEEEQEQPREPTLSGASDLEFAGELLRRLSLGEKVMKYYKHRRADLPEDFFDRPNLILGPPIVRARHEEQPDEADG